MKKLLLFIMMFPLVIFANNGYEVSTHIIDADVEIGGALHVEELIVIKGKTDSFSRKLNYYSFGDKYYQKGDKIDYNGSSIYNGYSLSIRDVAVFELKNQIDINDLTKDKVESLNKFDLTNPSNKGYSLKENDDGTTVLNIMYPIDGEIAVYIDYSVNNVVVKHNDVKELNYTFKNINLDSKETIVRVLTPYQVTEEESSQYNIWIHGNRNGSFQELVNDKEEKLGIYGVFEDTDEFNIRMTLPQNFVGVDMYLTESNEDALDKIVSVENSRRNRTDRNIKVYDNMIYVFVVIFVLLFIVNIVLGLMKLIDKRLFIILCLFEIFLVFFNYLFYQFKYYYLFLMVLVPFVGKLINDRRR